jgi:hypothetical protein
VASDAALTNTAETLPWRQTVGAWNRRVSIVMAMLTGLVVLLFVWAVTIRFGGWFGVALGWWPAMMIASVAAYAVGRAWHALALVAAIAVVVVGPGPMASQAAAASETVIALVGDQQGH